MKTNSIFSKDGNAVFTVLSSDLTSSKSITTSIGMFNISLNNNNHNIYYSTINNKGVILDNHQVLHINADDNWDRDSLRKLVDDTYTKSFDITFGISKKALLKMLLNVCCNKNVELPNVIVYEIA